MFKESTIEEEFLSTKKVISYSIWGTNSIYLEGLRREVRRVVADPFFSEWECWIYYNSTVRGDYIGEIVAICPERVKFITLENKYKEIPAWNRTIRMWRFLPIDDPEVELMICRDCDSMFDEREKMTVAEWLNSGKQFHITRDHPAHRNRMLAGMWGMRKVMGDGRRRWIDGKMEELVVRWVPHIHDNYSFDEKFLEICIYPHTVGNRVIHDEITRHEGAECRKYPRAWINYRFIGEKVYPNGESVDNYLHLLVPIYQRRIKQYGYY
jgi:hypothetical protein